jgi:hypothetical protein
MFEALFRIVVVVETDLPGATSLSGHEESASSQ